MISKKVEFLNTLKHSFLVFILILSSCETLEVVDFKDYPLRIEPLESNELQELNERYQSENDDHICSTLNEYGFTGFSRSLFPNDENPCLNRDVVRIQVLNSDSLVIVAKEGLVKNKEFTNVEDISELEVEEVLPLFGCTICEGSDINSVEIEWKITFSNQKSGNTPIQNSTLTVFVDALGINRIWGNWYPEFTSAGFINVGYLEAQNMLVGWEINMEPYTGESEIFIIQKEHLTEEPLFEFVPYINEGILELRRTWRVSISYKNDSFEGWNANIDVYDGLLLSVLPKNNLDEI